jgi:MICOS complex subunit MIC19
LTNWQTDSTRQKNAELHIQARVNDELRRIRDAQAKQIEELAARLTINPAPETPATPEEPQRDPNSLAAHLSSPFYQDHSPKAAAAPEKAADSGRSHDSVQQEIMALRQKLEARKKVDRSSPEVERAKESLVQCLRINDRRPLDCWQEVEQFKQEVGKLEQAFVQKVGR